MLRAPRWIALAVVLPAASAGAGGPGAPGGALRGLETVALRIETAPLGALEACGVRAPSLLLDVEAKLHAAGLQVLLRTPEQAQATLVTRIVASPREGSAKDMAYAVHTALREDTTLGRRPGNALAATTWDALRVGVASCDEAGRRTIERSVAESTDLFLDSFLRERPAARPAPDASVDAL